MNKIFSDKAWEDYIYWQSHDKEVLNKVNDLLKDIERNKNKGLGKPEPLKHDLSGYWSRRITNEHRLIYCIENNGILLASCRFHYDK